MAGNNQRKNAAMMMLDSDDDNSSVSSTSTMRSDFMAAPGNDEMQVEKDSLLDQALDALFEKRYSFYHFVLCYQFSCVMCLVMIGNMMQSWLHCTGVCLYVFICVCRGSTREKALASIVEAFNSSLQYEFVEKK